MKRIILILSSLLLFSCNGQDPKNVKRINNDNSWGFIDENGKEIIPLGVYEFLNPIDEKNMILAKKDGKAGYIDINKNIIIPFEYDDIGVFSDNDIAPANKSGKEGGLDRKGNEVIPFIYDELGYFYKSGLATVKKNGKYGFLDKNGNIIIPIKYDNANQTMSDNIVILSEKGNWAFFSNTGKQLTDFVYNDIKTDDIVVDGKEQDTYFKGGVVVVKKGNKYNLLDKNLNEINKRLEFDDAENFTNKGFSIVQNNGKFGVLSNSGNLILPINYKSIEHPQRYSNKLEIFAVKKNQYYQIFNNDLKPITTFNIIDYNWIKFQKSNKIIDALILETSTHKFGIIDANSGSTLLSLQYDNISPIDNEIFIVKNNNHYGIVNSENKQLIPITNTEIYPTEEHYVIESRNGSKLLDKNFNSVFKNSYQELQPIYYDEDNKFIAKNNNKFGVINSQEKVIVPFKYDKISNWVEYGPKAHFITENSKKGLLSQEGKIIIPTEYDSLFYISDDYIIVGKNKKFGILNIHNKIIIPIYYDRIYIDWYETKMLGKQAEIYVLNKNLYSIVNEKNEIIKTNISPNFIKEKFNYTVK